jgi:hypothetical protein
MSGAPPAVPAISGGPEVRFAGSRAGLIDDIQVATAPEPSSLRRRAVGFGVCGRAGGYAAFGSKRSKPARSSEAFSEPCPGGAFP